MANLIDSLVNATECPHALLRFEGIEKSFFGVPVLKAIAFSLQPGHTLGLVGENGAGKSTLMNILGGNHQADAGRILLDGKDYAPRNPQAATAAGIAFIHQELNLFPNLSIAENIFLTAFPHKKLMGLAVIQKNDLRARTKELLEQVSLDVAPETPIEKLSTGERQLVEIAKALSIKARIIIFDEPTTSLTAREAEHLFALMQKLRTQGLSMIYISHILGDVLRLCDEIVVLRDGEVVEQGAKETFTIARLISLMVGRDIQHLYPPRESEPSLEAILEVEGVSQKGIVKDISFQLHRGEVLGIAGLMGAGRSELARILFGLEPFARGEIRLQGQPLSHMKPAKSIRSGLAFLTEDRRADGLCLEGSIRDNMALVCLRSYAGTPLRLIQSGRLRDALGQIRHAVRLTGGAGEQAVKTLSGGNQQKVVLANWLLNRPQVFILDEPTRGIDVGAKFEVYNLINGLAAQGAGVLVISSEIEELIGICDRILVMARGEIKDCIQRADFERERVLRAALGEALPA